MYVYISTEDALNSTLLQRDWWYKEESRHDHSFFTRHFSLSFYFFAFSFFLFFTFLPFILPCMCVREQGLCNPCCYPFIYIYVCMYMYIMYVTKKSLSVTLVSTHIFNCRLLVFILRFKYSLSTSCPIYTTAHSRNAISMCKWRISYLMCTFLYLSEEWHNYVCTNP